MIKSLISGLYSILTTSIANPRFYFARSLGFRSEIELEKYFKNKKIDMLSGGQFLFGKKTETKHNLLYITIINDEIEKYLDLYSKLSKIPVVKNLFFIKFTSSKNWGTYSFNLNREDKIHIFQPDWKCYKFIDSKFQIVNINELKNFFIKRNAISYCRKKENRLTYLSDYPLNVVESIYANRFFLDVFLKEYKKGMIDFDGILKAGLKYYLLETKEKDAGGDLENKYFGWDSRRLAWYFYINHYTDLKTLYIIREVNNQQERKFLKWNYISLENFADSASWLSESGGGGNSGTITVPVSAFKLLDSLKL